MATKKRVKWNSISHVVEVPRGPDKAIFPVRPEGVSHRNFRTLPANAIRGVGLNAPTDPLRIDDTIVYHFDTIVAILTFLKKRVTDVDLETDYKPQMDRGYQTDIITVNNTPHPTSEEDRGTSILAALRLNTQPATRIKQSFLIVMSYLIEITTTLFDTQLSIVKNPYVVINPLGAERATNSVTIEGQADREIKGSIQRSFGIGKMIPNNGNLAPELINPTGSTTDPANRKRYGSIVCKYEFKLMPNGAGSVHCTYTITTTDPTILANMRKIPDSLPALMKAYDKISTSLVNRLTFPEHTPGKTSGQAKAANEAAFNECKISVANTFLPAMQYRQTRPKPPVSVSDLTKLFPPAQFPREGPPLTAITDYILYMYMTVYAIKNAPCYSYARLKRLANNAATQHSSIGSVFRGMFFRGSQADPHSIADTLSLSEKILGLDPPSSAAPSASASAAVPAGGAGGPSSAGPASSVLSPSANVAFITPAPNAAAFSNPDQLTVIWVRHGLSCQNIRSKLEVLRKKDPELCKTGILHAIETGETLRTKLRAERRDPIVGASVLMRAQQTAYLMLGNSLNDDNKIHILPYISENAIGQDNVPLPRVEQSVFYETYMSGIQDFLEDMYLEDKADYSLSDKTPNLSKFNAFLASNFDTFRDRGLLLFSHGHVIRSLYKNLNQKNNVVNCSAHKATYTREGKLVAIEPYTAIESEPSEVQEPNICLNADAPLDEGARMAQYESILRTAGFLTPSNALLNASVLHERRRAIDHVRPAALLNDGPVSPNTSNSSPQILKTNFESRAAGPTRSYFAKPVGPPINNDLDGGRRLKRTRRHKMKPRRTRKLKGHRSHTSTRKSKLRI